MKTHSTTIVAVKRDNKVAIAGDGQVTLGNGIIKNHAKKVRLLAGGKIIAGFAGSAADGIALLERLEQKLEGHTGNLTRASVELAKEWRMAKALRHLEAVILVSDGRLVYLLSGNGDIIEPDEDCIAIGSGAPYAHAAARMLLKHTQLSALEIVREAITTASDMCIYTNHEITALELAP